MFGGGLELDRFVKGLYNAGVKRLRRWRMGQATAFTVSEAAQVLGVSRQAVHYLCRRGRLKWWLYGSRMMIARRSVYSYRDLRETLRAAKARQEEEARAKVEERERRRAKGKEDGRRWRK